MVRLLCWVRKCLLNSFRSSGSLLAVSEMVMAVMLSDVLLVVRREPESVLLSIKSVDGGGCRNHMFPRMLSSGSTTLGGVSSLRSGSAARESIGTLEEPDRDKEGKEEVLPSVD